jgi:hypothetical protein
MSPTALDGPLRNVAKALLGQFGKPGLVEYLSTGTYNPTTGEASQSTSRATVSGVVEDYSAKEIDGTTVLRGDLKWTIPAKDVTRPAPNDMVTLDDVRYTVITSRSHYSGEQEALYQVQLRK